MITRCEICNTPALLGTGLREQPLAGHSLVCADGCAIWPPLSIAGTSFEALAFFRRYIL